MTNSIPQITIMFNPTVKMIHKNKDCVKILSFILVSVHPPIHTHTHIHRQTVAACQVLDFSFRNISVDMDCNSTSTTQIVYPLWSSQTACFWCPNGSRFKEQDVTSSLRILMCSFYLLCICASNLLLVMEDVSCPDDAFWSCDPTSAYFFELGGGFGWLVIIV